MGLLVKMCIVFIVNLIFFFLDFVVSIIEIVWGISNIVKVKFKIYLNYFGSCNCLRIKRLCYIYWYKLSLFNLFI